jgi:O-antigen/teichoic acid export membrane protein
VVLGLGVYLTDSVFWGAVGLAVAWAFVLVTYDIRSGALILKAPPGTGGLSRHGGHSEGLVRPRWEMGTLAKLAWLALPLGLVMMLISLNANIPRYFVERYFGERELGIFAAIAYLQMAGTTVVGALGQSASPRLAKYYAAGDGIPFRRLLLKLAGIGALLGGAGILVALVAGRELLTLLYGPEYVQPELLLWLMVAAGIAYVASFLGYGVTAARYFQIQLPLFALVTAVTGLACLLLVPARGLRGVAVALVISSSVQAACSLVVVVRALRNLRRNTGGDRTL